MTIIEYDTIVGSINMEVLMIQKYLVAKFLNVSVFKRLLAIFVCTFIIFVNLFSADLVSIYDIQFTSNAGFDGTYPSSYLNQSVMIQGVVTAVGFDNNRIFISEPQGGAWSAIAVELNDRKVAVGDFIQVEGRVSEIMGMTTLTHTQNFKILLRNSSLPNPVTVSAYEALTSEAYESVLVRISNSVCKRLLSGNFLALLEDDTASINLANGFNLKTNNDFFNIGDNYLYVTGIIAFSFNRFSINPRYLDDIKVVTTGSQSSSWGKIKSLYR